MLKSLKLADVIVTVDWTMLTKKTKEGLVLIAVRSKKPIVITGGPMISMTLNTFVTIMRTSYAAYNLLQSSGA
ncbi:uncharacterized protein LOC122510274 [Leptopilina heterotoma]|uniref:uncharacterized protein LOC122510274 n=1 Tax=Leptopilina heterotoma TaxID=63436 RepID=UPI001CA86877|nr:uncharacterized protein LOC122510274 [Leptopilina heterotoma]